MAQPSAGATTMFQVINPDGTQQTLTQEELQRFYPDIYQQQVLSNAVPSRK